MNKKGFTTVELVVSFALVMVIATLLFQVVLSLKNLYINSGVKTQLLNKQSLVTNQINEQFVTKKIETFESCGNNCLQFVYRDGTSNNLVVNTTQRYIEFNNQRTYLLDDSSFGSIVMDKYQVPVNDDTIHNDAMLLLDIPIYYKNSKEDYGIHIAYQYNTTGVYIEPSQIASKPKDPNQEPGTDLAATLKEQYNASNTVGLLKDETGYYYKGTKEEVANNFVWFAGHLWRVISIDNDNNITMITQQPITTIQSAADSAPWTSQAEYESSYINHWLNDMNDGVFYKNLIQEDKDKLSNSIFKVGIYTNVIDITTEQKVGLLDGTQYTKAGGTNSFLDIKNYFWLGNQYDTSKVYSVDYNGNLNGLNPRASLGVRPVIRIDSLTFSEGNGTLENPYREQSISTNTSNIKIGEYISIPTTGTDCGEDKQCLFRVVSKDSNSIKVTLNGVVKASKFAESASAVTYRSGNTVDTVLTTFANTISNTYRYTGTDKVFGIGIYPYGTHYTAVQKTKYTGNVGLPVVGEMFTGNDIDASSQTTKTFVNINTIENPTISGSFWTMNAINTTIVLYVKTSGFLAIDCGPLYNFNVRPVLFLNNNLTFTGGEGTAENPFTLE